MPDNSSQNSSEEKLAHLDWRRLQFGTDRLTVAHLREKSHLPLSFKDAETIDLERACFEELVMTMTLERELVQMVYCREAGIPESESSVRFEEYDDVVRLLADQYQSLGITSGQNESRLLIKNIESQAMQLAKPYSNNRNR